MNAKKKIKGIALSVLLCLPLLFVGCDNDDVSMSGQLELKFSNHATDLEVSIYSLTDNSVPIVKKKVYSGVTLYIPLNIGDYVIQPFASGVFYNKVGFQIQQDRTTTIVYDSNNAGKVQD